MELILGRDEVLAGGGFAGGRRGKRRCPHCSGRMRIGPLPGTDVEVDLCASHGFWLDKGELQEILLSRGKTADVQSLAEFCKSVFGGAAAIPPKDAAIFPKDEEKK